MSHERYHQLIDQARQDPNPFRAQAAKREAARIAYSMQQVQDPGRPQYTGGGSRNELVPHSNIQLDQVHPPDPRDFIQPLMAPSRYLVVGNIPVVAPQVPSAGVRLEFSAGGGWLIGWRGQAVDFTAGAFAAGQLEQASIGVSMFLNDGEELISNGNAVDFAPFSTLFGDAVQWSPIMRRVDVKDILTLNFTNFQPVVGGNNLQPQITFAFWREKYPGTG